MLNGYKYYFIKDSIKEDNNILYTLSNQDKLKLFNVILNIINEKLVVLENYYKINLIHNHDLVKNSHDIIARMFSYIKNNLLYVTIIDNTIDKNDTMINLKNLSFRYFHLITKINKENMQKDTFIPYIQFFDKLLVIIDDKTDDIAHILSLLLKVDDSINRYEALSNKVLYNLALSYHLSTIDTSNHRELSDIVKNKFYYLKKQDFKYFQYGFNKKLELYYLLSLSYMKSSQQLNNHNNNDLMVFLNKQISLIGSNYYDESRELLNYIKNTNKYFSEIKKFDPEAVDLYCVEKNIKISSEDYSKIQKIINYYGKIILKKYRHEIYSDKIESRFPYFDTNKKIKQCKE